MIIGAGINHWYRNNLMYRAPIYAQMFCGCVGLNGGGLAHYVGQEKLAPGESWSSIAFGRDTADLQVKAVRNGWLPSYPQFSKNPLRAHSVERHVRRRVFPSRTVLLPHDRGLPPFPSALFRASGLAGRFFAGLLNTKRP